VSEENSNEEIPRIPKAKQSRWGFINTKHYAKYIKEKNSDI
jgi:hypothetical protein